MNNIKEKLRLFNLQIFGEKIDDQAVHCMFCGQKALISSISDEGKIINHKLCDHILFFQHSDGFEYIRDDVKKSTEATKMIEHYGECENCGVMKCEIFEDLSKDIILNDSFVILYEQPSPSMFWEMIGFSPYRINELNRSQLIEKHNDNLIQKKGDK